MELNNEEVRKIAHLARLALHEDEVQALGKDLSNILHLVNTLQKVDTKDIQPLANPLDATQRLRDDTVTETDNREAFQALAPQVEASLYCVPQVIE